MLVSTFTLLIICQTFLPTAFGNTSSVSVQESTVSASAISSSFQSQSATTNQTLVPSPQASPVSAQSSHSQSQAAQTTPNSLGIGTQSPSATVNNIASVQSALPSASVNSENSTSPTVGTPYSTVGPSSSHQIGASVNASSSQVASQSNGSSVQPSQTPSLQTTSVSSTTTNSTITVLISPSEPSLSSAFVRTTESITKPTTETASISASLRLTKNSAGDVMVYSDDLKNSSHPKYKTLEDEFKTNMNNVFKNDASYEGSRVVGFRSGSVIVDFLILVQANISTDGGGTVVDTDHVKNAIVYAINTNQLGYEADASSLKVQIANCVTGLCANGGTCYSVNNVAICKCGRGYYGTQCEGRESLHDDEREILLIILVITTGSLACLALLCAALASRRASLKQNELQRPNGSGRYDNLGFNSDDAMRAKKKSGNQTEMRSLGDELHKNGNKPMTAL